MSERYFPVNSDDNPIIDSNVQEFVVVRTRQAEYVHSVQKNANAIQLQVGDIVEITENDINQRFELYEEATDDCFSFKGSQLK
tara:strand:+ start:1303 stop:1551 length:249 start_codon:yes stop_codon:yes gene_type:complete